MLKKKTRKGKLGKMNAYFSPVFVN